MCLSLLEKHAKKQETCQEREEWERKNVLEGRKKKKKKYPAESLRVFNNMTLCTCLSICRNKEVLLLLLSVIVFINLII